MGKNDFLDFKATGDMALQYGVHILIKGKINLLASRIYVGNYVIFTVLYGIFAYVLKFYVLAA